LGVGSQHVDPGARPSFSEIVCRLEADTTTFADRMKGFLGKQRLLDEILPPHVAEQLAAGHKAQPEHFDEVTIFFSDIVGFTGIAQYLAPEQVMCMLDELYGKFDDLVKKHDLFKVETIGDAYMCVGNLRSRQPDHAHRIARFAMDAVDAASETLGASLRCV
jgi:guanylate cyclase